MALHHFCDPIPKQTGHAKGLYTVFVAKYVTLMIYIYIYIYIATNKLSLTFVTGKNYIRQVKARRLFP